jgi:hypothetical protein
MLTGLQRNKKERENKASNLREMLRNISKEMERFCYVIPIRG